MKFTLLKGASLSELRELIPNISGWYVLDPSITRFDGYGIVQDHTVMGITLYEFPNPVDDPEYRVKKLFMIAGLTREDECILKIKGCKFYTFPEITHDKIIKARKGNRTIGITDSAIIAEIQNLKKG